MFWQLLVAGYACCLCALLGVGSAAALPLLGGCCLYTCCYPRCSFTCSAVLD